MSDNWKKYTSDPKYLIALLPGLEIARDSLNQEIENIRQAVSAGVQHTKLLAAPKPSFDSTDMTAVVFLTAVVKHLGGEATNAQLKEEANLHPRFQRLATSRSGLSAQLSQALNKGTLKRVAPGVVRTVK